MKSAFLCLMMAALFLPLVAGAEPTFGERLGWKATDRVLIVHNDDTGMSHEANLGTIEAYEKGVLSSNSVMMPCSWVPEWRDYMLANGAGQRAAPDARVGVEALPVAARGGGGGGSRAGGQGRLHAPGVMEVYQHATADEVETEIRAQIELAERMGCPSRTSTRTWARFSTIPGIRALHQGGIEKQIPIMMISGRGEAENEVQRQMLPRIQAAAKMVWEGGLPVLDYLYTSTADTNDPEEMTEALIKNLRELKPGITQIILHATRHSPNFEAISGSGKKREAELEMVLSPAVKKVIEEEGIILTTYRELMERRKAVK